MAFNTKFFFVFSIFFISQCSTLKKIIYHPEINQGNYFLEEDIEKLYIGMDKKNIVYIFGEPILNNVFNDNTWHYIFYKKTNVNEIEKLFLTLFFNSKNKLVNFHYQQS